MGIEVAASELLWEVKDGVCRITLNREARRNAINVEMIARFNECLDQVENDPSVRVMLVTGAGDKVFCSGADLTAGLGDAGDAPLKYTRLLKRMSLFPRPFIARLNGHCMAGGMGLMLSCDLVYAHEGVKIGTPEVKVGLFPMMIGALLFRNAVRKKVLELIYTAQPVSAAEAERMGLLTRVYPTIAEMDAAVDKTAAAIRGNAPAAIAIGRRALAEADDMDLDRGLEYLCTRLNDVLRTEDAAEGLMAFAMKREPEWKGK